MDENNDFAKNKGPYHGVLLVVLFLLGIPAILYLIFNSLLSQTSSGRLCSLQAQVFAGAISTAFCITLIITGVLEKPSKIVRKRIAELLESLRYSGLKYGFKWYFDDIRQNGLVFWIYLFLIGANVFFLINGLMNLLHLLGAF